jgi:two-component sensor histidine kinase
MAELDHRVKNILASIQAMVRQTGKGASSLEDFTQALEQRIRAMADTHGLLAANHWHGARLRSMVEDELAPYRAANGGNVQLSGDDIMLSPKAALPFTLVLHELASNAAKYGSLSTPAGCVRVSWRLDPGDGALVVTWKELRGPPVAPPARRGFGSVIIERSLRYELAGECTLTFAADGVGCIISLPSEYVADENGLTDHD